MADTKTITPSVLAEELKVDAKRIRAYLRANHGRKIEAKNTSWFLSAAVAKDVREHFSSSKKAAPKPKTKARTKKAPSKAKVEA